jgi:hypothetical protein
MSSFWLFRFTFVCFVAENPEKQPKNGNKFFLPASEALRVYFLLFVVLVVVIAISQRQETLDLRYLMLLCDNLKNRMFLQNFFS